MEGGLGRTSSQGLEAELWVARGLGPWAGRAWKTESSLHDGKTPAFIGASKKEPGYFPFNRCKFSNKIMFPSKLEGVRGEELECLDLGYRQRWAGERS